MRRLRVYLLAGASVFSGCVFITGNLTPFATMPAPLDEYVVSGEGKAKILLVDVSRVITTQEDEGAFGLSRREGLCVGFATGPATGLNATDIPSGEKADVPRAVVTALRPDTERAVLLGSLYSWPLGASIAVAPVARAVSVRASR